MIVDARQIEDGAELRADLCVIGAGAAGITVALEFLGEGAIGDPFGVRRYEARLRDPVALQGRTRPRDAAKSTSHISGAPIRRHDDDLGRTLCAVRFG